MFNPPVIKTKICVPACVVRGEREDPAPDQVLLRLWTDTTCGFPQFETTDGTHQWMVAGWHQMALLLPTAVDSSADEQFCHLWHTEVAFALPFAA